LPVVTKVYTFPFGTDVTNVDVTFSGITKQILSKKIEPAPQPVPLLASEILPAQNTEVPIDEQVYTSSERYPQERYTYRTGAGLKDREHVIYLAVRCYPVQYSPAEDTIYVASSIDIDVEYQLPKNPIVFPDEYDMVIITPAKWESKLQALVDHKNDMGVVTTVKTVEDIYAEFDGRDEPEDIKLFIKDAIENWGIDYVLLFGGRKGQNVLGIYQIEKQTTMMDGKVVIQVICIIQTYTKTMELNLKIGILMEMENLQNGQIWQVEENI